VFLAKNKLKELHSVALKQTKNYAEIHVYFLNKLFTQIEADDII